jgi:hypothetical protein
MRHTTERTREPDDPRHPPGESASPIRDTRPECSLSPITTRPESAVSPPTLSP